MTTKKIFVVPLLTVENLCKDRLDQSFGACLAQRNDYYSGNQFGSAVGLGNRITPKVFNRGQLGGFSTFDFWSRLYIK